MSTASPSSKRNTIRQLPDTLPLHCPRLFPLNWCIRQPDTWTSRGDLAYLKYVQDATDADYVSGV